MGITAEFHYCGALLKVDAKESAECGAENACCETAVPDVLNRNGHQEVVKKIYTHPAFPSHTYISSISIPAFSIPEKPRLSGQPVYLVNRVFLI